MMQLSIIIPHHNTPHLLAILLNSIGCDPQTQIIVIDDHSDKNNDELQTLNHKSEYAHVLFLECPTGQKGPGCARNLGIDRATGKYLMFCDADDYLEEGYRSIIQPYIKAETDLIYFTPVSRILGTLENAHRVDKYIHLIEDYIQQPNQQTDDALRYTFYISPSKLIKRTLVEKHHLRFDELMVSEDVMFSTQVGALAKTIQATKEVIYCATRSANSLTMTQTQQTYDLRFKVLLRQHDYVKSAIGIQRYRKLDLPALVFVVNAFTYHLGFKVAFNATRIMMHHHIPVFSRNNFKLRRIVSFLRLNQRAKKAAQQK